MRTSAAEVVREYIKARQSEFNKIEFSEKAIEVPIRGRGSQFARRLYSPEGGVLTRERLAGYG